MMADRITFLHPKDESGDEDVELEQEGRVYPHDNRIKLKESSVPSWFKAGVFVVATDRKGNTIEGHAIDWRRLGSPHSDNRRSITLDDSFI